MATKLKPRPKMTEAEREMRREDERTQRTEDLRKRIHTLRFGLASIEDIMNDEDLDDGSFFSAQTALDNRFLELTHKYFQLIDPL